MAPGGFDTGDIPQIILVSFQYGVSSANVDKYTQLLEGIVNPNQCPVRGSFFVTQTNTQFQVVRQLVDRGHEAGVSSMGVATPTTVAEWAGNFTEVKKALVQAGVSKDKVVGVRAPELKFGGTNQVLGMRSKDLNLQYDSSCLNTQFDQGNYLWPFTFDYGQGIPDCTAGSKLNGSFPGVWEFPIADLRFKGVRCASPSGCSPFIKTEKDAYDLFFNAFTQHYNQRTRPPFVMFIDPAWLTDDKQAKGTNQFLQFVGAAYEDTWIITTQQALAWIMDPVPASKVTKFEPWGCQANERKV
ncbi:hypothetical protein RRG08_017242 [Elysia crispata]|uniref:NodB homology domain-containing protein n=1 Tax=Elysia crispata TaxID=231223 RepID=A0AAE1CLI2_9GAST|nr:hypothetical protein RRG08_017242 [Elysia crispata]